jgi:hypothetical protein
MLTVWKGDWIGLGNQLFILAAGESYAKQSGRKFYISDKTSCYNPHSRTNYFDTIFKHWDQFHLQDHPPTNLIVDPKLGDPLPDNAELIGFYQDWKIVEPVREQFINRLTFNTDILKKYPDISERVFIHVRGGDYLTWVGFLDLTNYYRKCLSMIKDKVVVFTNDIHYAQKVLQIPFEYIVENEEDTLYLMSKCKGCICANSSFSWWGAYLNPNRQIFIPSKWNKDSSTQYSFPGTTIVDV